MEEEANKVKMTHSEKRTTRLQNKFRVLREKVDKEPPSTLMGREHIFKKLNILSAKIDGRMDLNDRRALRESEIFNEEDEYYNKQKEISGDITDLSLRKNAISNEIKGLKKEKTKNDKQQRIITGKMSKRYKSQLCAMEGTDKVSKRKQDLKEELKRIDLRIKEQEKLVRENIKISAERKKAIKLAYKQDLKEIRKNNKERLAKANPSLFRRIGNWLQERREKSAKMLMEALKETEQSSKRKMFLQSNASNISLREQADNAAKAREGFSNRREYKTMQVAGENPNKAEKIEWLSESQERLAPEEQGETGTEIR